MKKYDEDKEPLHFLQIKKLLPSGRSHMGQKKKLYMVTYEIGSLKVEDPGNRLRLILSEAVKEGLVERRTQGKMKA